MSEREAGGTNRTANFQAHLKKGLVNYAVKGRQNANAMFKSASFGFANSCRFVLVLLLRSL